MEKPIENICTLENALNTMSNTLTQEVKFELQTIEFVYKGSYSNDTRSLIRFTSLITRIT